MIYIEQKAESIYNLIIEKYYLCIIN